MKYNVISKETKINPVTGQEIPVEIFTGPYAIVGHDIEKFYVVHVRFPSIQFRQKLVHCCCQFHCRQKFQLCLIQHLTGTSHLSEVPTEKF